MAPTTRTINAISTKWRRVAPSPSTVSGSWMSSVPRPKPSVTTISTTCTKKFAKPSSAPTPSAVVAVDPTRW